MVSDSEMKRRLAYVKGDKQVELDLETKWKEQVSKMDLFPREFKLTKREWEEHQKSLTEDEKKKVGQGLPLYRGSRVKIV